MGWTSYQATHYKNGKVDRKAEMDERFTQYEHEGSDFNGGTCHYPQMTVLKSAMVGSVYYAAVETKRTGEEPVVWAAICLTSTDWDDGMNFGYKDMDETMHPYQYNCPKGILDLLSETDNESALEWRKMCIEHRKNKNNPDTLSNLPIGSIIEYRRDGKDIRLTKHAPGYQFKRPFWWDGTYHYHAKYIPNNYVVVKRGEIND